MPEPSAKFLNLLPAADRSAVMAVARPWQADAETVLYRHGEMPRGIWMLDVGFVRYEGFDSGGVSAMAAFSGPGACFGEGELFERHPSSVTAITTLACEGWFMPAASLFDVVGAVPSFNLLMLAKLSRNVRLLQTVCRVTMTFQPRERLALCMLNLAQQVPVNQSQSKALTVPLTQERLCQVTGCSRQFISKQLSEWRKLGWIAVHYRAVEVVDPDALRAIFPEDTDPVVFALLPSLPR